MVRYVSTLSLLIVIAASTLTGQSIWKADKAHSKVEFTVSHMVISEVTGKFKDFDVSLLQTNDDFTGSTIDATIAVGSVSTDNDNRDRHLR